MNKGISITITLVAPILLGGCVLLIPPQLDVLAKSRRMAEYRQNANKTLQRSDFQQEINIIARQDPKFETVYVALVHANLAQKKLVVPKLKKWVEPTYPMEMRMAWKEADAFFALIVGKDGRLASVAHIVHPDLPADPPFIVAAKAALAQFEYEPGLIDGEVADYAMVVPLAFRLN